MARRDGIFHERINRVELFVERTFDGAYTVVAFYATPGGSDLPLTGTATHTSRERAEALATGALRRAAA